jgi:hypothetical protein
MAHVCEDWFPLTDDQEDKRKYAGFYMDERLKSQLDVLIKNSQKDWDFTIIVSGSGEMRVGKSLMAAQIAAYWTYELEKKYGIKVPFNVKENFVLNGQELIIKGNKLGQKYKCASLIFDEAADDLESTKVLKAATQAIKDYLRKAAQYNMLNLIVQSEFFEVPKPIAISRSICLIDVSYSVSENGIFKRGTFKFYNRPRKKYLYLKGKRDLNYNCTSPNFTGSFPHFYPMDEKEYREEKKDSLTRWKTLTQQEFRRLEWLRGALRVIYQQGLSHREIADIINNNTKFKISYRTVGRMIANEKYDDLGEENET